MTGRVINPNRNPNRNPNPNPNPNQVEQAAEFADAVHAAYPGKMLAHNRTRPLEPIPSLTLTVTPTMTLTLSRSPA